MANYKNKAKKRPSRVKKNTPLLGLLFAFLFTLSALEHFGVPTWSRLFAALEEKQVTPAVIFVENDAKGARVHVIDVGQGDAVLFEQDGHFALLDTGEGQMRAQLLAYLEKLGVTHLDYLIISHLHTDHMGAAYAVFEELTVGLVVLPDTQLAPLPTNITVQRFFESLIAHDAEVETAQRGFEYPLADAVITVVNAGVQSANINNTSLAIRFDAGALSYLGTGDGELLYEEKFLNSGWAQPVLIFKAGHHGSYTANSLALLQALSPQYVAVTCGDSNSYGFPHTTPMRNFAAVEAEVYRTDINGTIVFTEDGGRVKVQVERNEE